jgi:hypothetical protein
LAERLLEKETIGLPDIVEILGPRPTPLKASLLDYLEELKERINEDEREAELKKEEEANSENVDKVSEDEGDEDPKEDKDSEEKDKEQKDK